ncbi:M67 family metallopeptidase [Thermaurantiacus sp.]
MQVLLARAARERIEAATAEAYPCEACGLLFGGQVRGRPVITSASVARNVAAEPWHRFEIDPAHLFASQREARETGAPILGVWHSHPHGRPIPSAEDRAGVTDPAWLWLIAAAGRPRPTLAAHVPDPSSPTGFRPLLLLDEAGHPG